MKRIIFIVFCILISTISFAQSIPELEKGARFMFPLDKNGKKYLEFYLQDIQYSDSTIETCQALYTFRVVSSGIETVIGNTSEFSKKTTTIVSPYFKVLNGSTYNQPIGAVSISNNVIPKDSAVQIQFKLECFSKRYAEFFVNNHKTSYANLYYDGKIYREKLATEKRMLWAQQLYDSLLNTFTIDVNNLETCGEERFVIYREYPAPSNWQGESYYLIDGGNAIEVHMYNERLKYDTTFHFNKMSPFLMEQYLEVLSECTEERNKQENEIKRLVELRNKKVTEIDAREVFDYFKGTDIVEFTKLMGNKKLAVTPCCYETTFYDKSEKKDVLFQFTFWDGKLASIKRESTNTMPTNDVWSAFMLLEAVDTYRNLEEVLKVLKK
jgi:hypothetical protein